MTRKKILFITLITLLFIALCINVFGQSSYPFKVQKTGSGKKNLLFIPGFACSGDVWNETKAVYEKDYTCYALTMAGFAGVKPEGKASFNAWANAIATFIKDNRLDKPVLVGHSMGGCLALAVAAQFPELTGKIVVVDALPCLPALMAPDFKANSQNDCSEITKRLTSMSNEEFHEMQKLSISQMLANTAMHETVINWSLQSDRTTFAGMYCDFFNTDLREKLQTITCPVLILLEPSFSGVEKAVNDQYKNLKTGVIKYADKGLHFIMFDDKEWYMNQLKVFIGDN